MISMLSLYLAQVPSAPPAGTDKALEIFFYAIGGITALVVLYRQFYPAQIQPQPLQVQQHPGIATAEQLREVHGRIARERKEIDANLEFRRQETAAVSKKLDLELKEMRQTMDEIPKRTIDLLHSTKGLL